VLKIVVRSRYAAAEFVCDRPWAAIQISSTAGTWPHLLEANRVAVLQLAFLDRTRDGPDLFTEAMADEVLDFVAAHADAIETLMVHCEAGWSRSPAVAAAVTEAFLGGDAAEFMARYAPNHRVLTLLRAAARRRGLTAGDPPAAPAPDE
jgi:predicted protein tyrosine phosphatase